MEKITFEESRRIQFEILTEIDSFCNQHNILYFLAYGTLLGAVRHKGYIPWDDDTDVCMPRPDFERFLNEYKTTVKYETVTFKSGRGFYYNFARLTDRRTINVNATVHNHGISVDIYPLDGVPDPSREQSLFFNHIYKDIYAEILCARAISVFGRYNIKIMVFFSTIICKYLCKRFYRNALKYEYEQSRYVAVLCGDQRLISLPKYWFNERICISFEARQFYAPKKFDEILTMVFNDYMKLPPVEQRVPYHCGNYYWK